MSLVSIIYGNAYPVIVSDRAISDCEFLSKVALPTTGKEPAQSTHVVEFRVKFLIIKDILCVAFAGLVIEIERMREEIVDYFLHRDVNKKNLEEFIIEIADHSPNVSILYALGGPEFENNKVMVVCSGNWLQDHSKEKLDILACGSGAAEWIEHFVEYHNYLESSGDRSTDCKHRALIACVKFISKEIMQSIGRLQEGWGGGFDIVYYENGQFHFYDEVAYAFFYVREEEQPGPIWLYSINHNRYLNGNAIVLNIYYEREPTFHIVPKFKNEIPIDADSLDIKCKSSDIISCIFIKTKDGTLSTLVVLMKEWKFDKMPMFLGAKVEGVFRFAFKGAFTEGLKESLRLFLN
jgi:hypothetical protein